MEFPTFVWSTTFKWNNILEDKVTIKRASQDEFDKIHQLNHQVFAEEIPQHRKTSDGKLIDPFHDLNKYIVAMRDAELIGMVCYNNQRPFSLDKKLNDLDSYLPAHKSMVEIRLFSVKPEYRRKGVAVKMLVKLIEELMSQQVDLAVISAIVWELDFYKKFGAVEFAHRVGTEQAPYQPMYFHIDNLQTGFIK
ncbi:MAG: GNAT family N-acetyltransferase [Flavobacteriales bacterium]